MRERDEKREKRPGYSYGGGVRGREREREKERSMCSYTVVKMVC